MTGRRPSPKAAAAQLGLAPVAIRKLRERGNTHWLVRTTEGDVVLRRYRATASQAAIDYELRVVGHLAAKGWPVPEVVAPPQRVDGSWWCAFSRLPGRTERWPRDDARHEMRGELLARLHDDTADLVALGQRDDWHRVDEAAEITPARIAALTRLRRLDRTRAVALEHHARGIGEGIAFLRADRFPLTVVHGDFLPWNMRISGSELIALFDFDASRLDSRMADLAFATWGGRYPAVLTGYAAISPLSEREEAALPLLWRAAWLSWGWIVVERSRDRVDPQLDEVLQKLARPWEG